MANDQTAAVNCAVCGEPAEAVLSAECNWCGQRFHLNQRNDIEAKDCGQVWIDEQFLALQFACNTCLTTGGPQSDDAPTHQSARQPEPDATARRRYKKRS